MAWGTPLKLMTRPRPADQQRTEEPPQLPGTVGAGGAERQADEDPDLFIMRQIDERRVQAYGPDARQWPELTQPRDDEGAEP